VHGPAVHPKAATRDVAAARSVTTSGPAAPLAATGLPAAIGLLAAAFAGLALLVRRARA
jgi:uncharacterized membrane protein YhaH (DUF805 family)